MKFAFFVLMHVLRKIQVHRGPGVMTGPSMPWQTVCSLAAFHVAVRYVFDKVLFFERFRTVDGVSSGVPAVSKGSFYHRSMSMLRQAFRRRSEPSAVNRVHEFQAY
jgi:hypothetical protein